MSIFSKDLYKTATDDLFEAFGENFSIWISRAVKKYELVNAAEVGWYEPSTTPENFCMCFLKQIQQFAVSVHKFTSSLPGSQQLELEVWKAQIHAHICAVYFLVAQTAYADRFCFSMACSECDAQSAGCEHEVVFTEYWSDFLLGPFAAIYAREICRFMRALGLNDRQKSMLIGLILTYVIKHSETTDSVYSLCKCEHDEQVTKRLNQMHALLRESLRADIEESWMQPKRGEMLARFNYFVDTLLPKTCLWDSLVFKVRLWRRKCVWE